MGEDHRALRSVNITPRDSVLSQPLLISHEGHEDVGGGAPIPDGARAGGASLGAVGLLGGVAGADHASEDGGAVVRA